MFTVRSLKNADLTRDAQKFLLNLYLWPRAEGHIFNWKNSCKCI